MITMQAEKEDYSFFTHETIAKRAYELWEKYGKPDRNKLYEEIYHCKTDKERESLSWDKLINDNFARYRMIKYKGKRMSEVIWDMAEGDLYIENYDDILLIKMLANLAKQ